MTSLKESRVKTIVVVAMAILILVPAGYGFISKLVYFIHVAGGERDNLSFIVIPLLNYFILAAGFFCLLLWAVAQGMFRDIERPKYAMLEQEEELDRLEQSARMNDGPPQPPTR